MNDADNRGVQYVKRVRIHAGAASDGQRAALQGRDLGETPGYNMVAVCVGKAGRCGIGDDGGLEARAVVLPRAVVVREAAAVRASKG